MEHSFASLLIERRIMELAQVQARRDETVHRLTVENGELKKKLLEAKRLLDKASDERVFLSDQIRRLQSSRQRGTVDIDYLKNVIVRYLQFENYPQQRKALVPVIATILHFNAQDHEAVNKGATAGTLWSKVLSS